MQLALANRATKAHVQRYSEWVWAVRTSGFIATLLSFSSFAIAADANRAMVALMEMISGPRMRFEAEAQGSCLSKNLQRAHANAVRIIAEADRARLDLSGRQEVAAELLAVGDAAQRAGCAAQAREIYDDVIELFIGDGFVAHRQRAEIALGRIGK